MKEEEDSTYLEHCENHLFPFETDNNEICSIRWKRGCYRHTFAKKELEQGEICGADATEEADDSLAEMLPLLRGIFPQWLEPCE